MQYKSFAFANFHKASLNLLFAGDFKTSSLNASQSLLPYTFAFVLETIRYSCALPIIAPRMATEDINLDSFHIKALTLGESKSFGDPESFRPERFSDATTGQLDHSKSRLMLSFGAGKRVCPAQKFAGQTILIFLVELLKRYDFLPLPNHPLPSISKGFGLSYSPKPFYAQVKNRKFDKGKVEQISNSRIIHSGLNNIFKPSRQ